MSYKDTLELFDELVAMGTPEHQARAQAKQLGAVTDFLVTMKNEVNNKLDKIDRDLIWMRVIGGAMTLAFLSSWFK